MATRTSVRVRRSNFFKRASRSEPETPREPPEGTVYHILTESPSLQDYTGFGPFNCIAATVPTVRRKLEHMSPSALAMFNEHLPQWLNGSVIQIKAPLDDNNHMLIRLLKERNPSVAAALPGPTWTVRCLGRDNIRPLEDVEWKLVGSHLKKDDAFETAREYVMSGDGVRKTEQFDEQGNLNVVAQTSDWVWWINASFDSGAHVHPHDYPEYVDQNPEMPTSASVLECRYCGLRIWDDEEHPKQSAICMHAWYYGQEC